MAPVADQRVKQVIESGGVELDDEIDECTFRVAYIDRLIRIFVRRID